MNKPYITLSNDFPGIVSLFQFHPELGKRISALGETLMRGPSPLSVGERELIAAYVSGLNECKFCCGSHTACARETGDAVVVNQVILDEDFRSLSDKMYALLKVAEAVQILNRDFIPKAIEIAKENGASDREIHDTVAIAAMFCMCNRYVDGLGTVYQESDLAEGGKSLAKYGYLMGVRRFIGEVVPKIWHKLTSK